MTLYAQNGRPVLDDDSPDLYSWTLPLRGGTEKIRLRRGAPGFVLCCLILWWDESMESVFGRVLDDWGFARRLIRGSSTEWSNHSTGEAVDVNAAAHPLGTRTLTRVQIRKLRWRVLTCGGVVRAGAFYGGRPDEMHLELVKGGAPVSRLARRWASSKRGRRLLAANPSQRAAVVAR